MSKKRNSVNYRKIYEQNFGPIPFDEFGRRYEIHHIDGNPNNNDINNLQCVSVQEHFDIHFRQGDVIACLLISRNLKISREQRSELARMSALKRLQDGTHNFLNKDSNKARVERGTHNFLGGEISRKTSRRRVREGTHILLGGKVQRQQIWEGKNKLVGGQLQRETAKNLLAQGKNQSQKIYKCGYCGKEIKGNAFFRYHGERCKNRE